MFPTTSFLMVVLLSLSVSLNHGNMLRDARYECGDKNGNCESWAKNGECEKNPGYMLRNCEKSCGMCTVGCGDTHWNCKDWAKNGECSKNPGAMLRNCRKSCEICYP